MVVIVEMVIVVVVVYCSGVVIIVVLSPLPCCSGYDYCTLHSSKPELRFCEGSNPARGVSEIRDGEDL